MRIWVITHLYPSPKRSRTGFFIHRSLKNLVKQGHQVKVFYFIPWIPQVFRGSIDNFQSCKFQNKYNIDGVQVIPLFYLPKLSIIFPRISVWQKQLTILRKIKNNDLVKESPDAVFAQTIYLDAAVSTKVATFLQIPLIAIMRGSDVHTFPQRDHRIKSLVTKVISRTNRLLAVSQGLYEDAKRIFIQVPEADVIYNICETNNFYKNTPIHHPPRRLLFVGAFVPTKGIFVLIEALL